MNNKNNLNEEKLSEQELNKRAASVMYLLEELAPYFSDSEITEICINAPNEIFYEKNSKWYCDKSNFYDYKNIKSLAIAIGKYTNKTINENKPILSAELPNKERIQIVMPPATVNDHISITIRKPSHLSRTLKDYREQGYFNRMRPTGNDLLPEETHLLNLKNEGKYEAFFQKAVELEKVIIVAGETGSGKTTFMKTLVQHIPFSQRIITIEDTPELFLPYHPNHVHLLYPSTARETDSVNATTLLKSCLRMKPDRILLAELRGAETFDFINICASGHAGSITSCHAGSAKLAIERLVLMMLQNPQCRSLSDDVIRRLIYMIIDVIVIVTNDEIGRFIPEIWYDPMSKRK